MIRKLTLQLITIFIIFCSLEGLELWTSFIHADLLNSLVDLDFHQFRMGALLLVAVYTVFLVVTYMDLRYRSFVKQKIATIWRDEVSEAISNTSYGHFHKRRIMIILLGLQVIWIKFKKWQSIQVFPC